MTEIEKNILEKLENIRVCGSKSELWNFEAAIILNLIKSQQREIEGLKEDVNGYRGLAKQIQKDYIKEYECYD